MGKASRRKQQQRAGADVAAWTVEVDRGPWLHGTDTPFDRWSVPPPRKNGEELAVPHTAVFLTKHEDYAAAAGGRICEASLEPQAKVLVAGLPSKASEALRLALRRHQVVAPCWWLRNEATWLESWRSGDVMRFAADTDHLQALVSRSASMLQKVAPDLPPEALVNGAQHNITRGWIEEIVKAARALGFDALQGHEIDRHAGPQPIARPWLAVFNADALSAPVWR